MKKLFNLFKSFNTFEVEKRSNEDFNYVIMEIIEDVLKKRTKTHKRYERLFEILWISKRPIQCKTYLAKYLLGRLLKESDRIFNKGQILATRLCPNCNNYKKVIGKVHSDLSKKTH